MIDNEPGFIGKEVCAILDIKNTTQALDFLDEDERSMFNIRRQGEANIISESGFYGLLSNSRKPQAKPFQKWVRKDVLLTQSERIVSM